jgi:hypothetical protein
MLCHRPERQRGGGFFNANSAHPFENQTAFADLVEMLLIFLIGTALTNTFGRPPSTTLSLAAGNVVPTFEAVAKSPTAGGLASGGSFFRIPRSRALRFAASDRQERFA